MPVTVIVGGQWGDEGKGKVVDLLATQADVVVRYSGGSNAGHTVVNELGEFRLHLVPSGIFNPDCTCIIGNGVLINPEVLLQELEALGARGVATSNLCISDRAHVVLPYHLLLDELEERARGSAALGTTKKGIGPALVDKVARTGIRMGDLQEEEVLREKLASAVQYKNGLFTELYSAEPLSYESLLERCLEWGERLGPHITDTVLMVQRAEEQGKHILFEGAQGTMLDPDFGTYPYVTSSSPLAGAAAIGSGLRPTAIGRVIGVLKAYTTRVGRGPLPTELSDEVGERIREVGREYGTTTGRPRRCGWFDGVVARYAARLNGMTGSAITRLDVLDGLPKVKLCVAYSLDGRELASIPASVKLFGRCQPMYEEMPGWQGPTRACRSFGSLPAEARAYLQRIESLLGCPIEIVSVGPSREETIFLKS